MLFNGHKQTLFPLLRTTTNGASPAGPTVARALVPAAPVGRTVAPAVAHAVPAVVPAVAPAATAHAATAADAPADAPDDASADAPAGGTADEPDDAPAGGTADAPADAPDDAPAGGTADAPADAPDDAPAGGTADAPSSLLPLHDPSPECTLSGMYVAARDVSPLRLRDKQNSMQCHQRIARGNRWLCTWNEQWWGRASRTFCLLWLCFGWLLAGFLLALASFIMMVNRIYGISND